MAGFPVQTSYAAALAVALEGAIADNTLRDYFSGINADVVEMPFGSWLALGGSVGDQGLILPAASTAKIVGVHLLNFVFAQTRQLGTTGVKVGNQITALTSGHIWVISETVAAPGDPVFIRYAAGAGGTRLGATRNAAVASETIDFTARAKYLTTCTAAGLAVVDLFGVG